MRVALPTKTRIFLILALALLWTASAAGQTLDFVQITDPHLFDKGDETENKAALTACIKKINERIAENADYKFVVITGDIGIENLVSHIVDERTKERKLEDQVTQERQLEDGAAQLATILAPTRIHLWLFVPGNNDLYDEEPNLGYYVRFLQKLKQKLPGLEIRDLSAAGDQNKYQVDGFTLIGFNNASFKNNNNFKRISQNEEIQRGYVTQVIKALDDRDVRALIFYHIPEIDDPHIVLNADTSTPKKREPYDGAYPDSSWFVDPAILKLWKAKVVKNPKVLGLFAGHLHDWRRETYAGSLSKLYICPPLAIKLQDDAPSQARGFQQIAVDGTGRISRTIFWYKSTDRTLDTDPSSRNNELELAFFYEREQQWSEAETHFREAAAKAQTSPARDAALAGLTRVKYPSHPWVNSALAWTDPLFYAPFVLRPLGLAAFGLIVGLLFIAIRDGFSTMLIHPFEGDDELAKLLAVGFPAVRAKVSAILSSSNEIFLPQAVQIAFPFVAPSLGQLFPAQQLDQLFPQEGFEVVGVKIPNLNVFVKWLVRPRYQVHGGFFRSNEFAFVYAEVWRRNKTWFGTSLATIVTREIPLGPRRIPELENFIYDV